MFIDVDSILSIVNPSTLQMQLGGQTFHVRPLSVAEARRIGEPFDDAQLIEYLKSLFVGGHPPVLDTDLSKIEDEREGERIVLEVTTILQVIYRWEVERESLEKKQERSRQMVRERLRQESPGEESSSVSAKSLDATGSKHGQCPGESAPT